VPTLLDELRVDRRAFSIGEVEDQAADYLSAALAMSPVERLRTVEVLRTMRYGPNLATERVQRVLEVLERGGR
jgi:hypothetical protein